jgi:hypothetical protein
MDKRKKPPPQGPELLTRGAGCKVLLAGTHTCNSYQKIGSKTYIDIHANQERLASEQVVPGWRFDFEQYMPASQFCQDVRLTGVQNKVAMSRLFSIP